MVNVAVESVLPLDPAGRNHDPLEVNMALRSAFGPGAWRKPVDALHGELVVLDGRPDVNLKPLSGHRTTEPLDLERLRESTVGVVAWDLGRLNDKRDLDLHGSPPYRPRR